MSQPRGIGPGAGAGAVVAGGTLPVTGMGDLGALILIAVALLVTGLLLIRTARYRRHVG